MSRLPKYRVQQIDRQRCPNCGFMARRYRYDFDADWMTCLCGYDGPAPEPDRTPQSQEDSYGAD